jgi:hypothetical protein
MAAERQERVYRLEPLDASGVFLGLGAVQCALLGTGISLAVAVVTLGLPLPAAGAPVLAAVAASFAHIGSHPAWEWLPLGWAWLRSQRRLRRRWAAPLPLLPTGEAKAPPLPPCLAGLDVLEVPWRGQLHLGAVRDGERQTLTALVPATGPPFSLQARPEQERLLGWWGDLLGQFAVDGSAVSHLFWSDLARPSGLDEHRAWLAESRRHTGEPGNAEAQESYGQLLDLAADTAVTHEVVVGITVTRDRLTRRHRGLHGVDEHLAQALATSVEALLRSLRAAAIAAGDPLDATGVHRLLRRRLDPAAAAAHGGRGRLGTRLGLVTPASSGPLVVETSWRHVRVDGAWHRTWWIACWPRLAVPPGWLEPFLSHDGVTRTMTVVMVPVPVHQSRRRIERDLVKLTSDASTKEEKGRRVDARHQRATDALLDREAELVAGYAEMAYAGLVSIAARSEDELDEKSDIVEQLAHEAGMELRLLDGRQDAAWAAALPLGLAPKTLLAT